MKKMFLLLLLAVAVLAGPTFLGAYDLEPYTLKIVPEAIWSPATGGGTWITELQITSRYAGANLIRVWFWYNGGYRGPFTLTTISTQNYTWRTTNLLSSIDNVDGGVFTYYGRVGAAWFESTGNIQVTAKTVNGSYGKTLPGMKCDYGTTAGLGRPMMIPLMYNGSVNRSAVGFINTSGSSITATFWLVNASWQTIGSSFSKTFSSGNFQAFDPFIQAGVSSSVYTNAWLYIVPTAGTTGIYGLMGFGSVVNNTTNDPAAIVCVPYNTETASLAPSDDISAIELIKRNLNN